MPGHPRVLVSSVDVGVTSVATFDMHPKATTTYTAVWAGDEWYTSSHDTADVAVHPRVHDKLTGGSPGSGGVRTYHYTPSCGSSGRGCPGLVGWLSPKHAGKRLTFLIQLHTSSGWRSLGSAAFRMRSSGRAWAVLVYRSTAVIGQLQRFRAIFDGDIDHLGGKGPWKKFKIGG